MRLIDRSSREEAVSRLSSDVFDVVVVGGGVTGAGCALDAVSRGLRTGLIERKDFASGTSSKSSKLVHGGLRYLAQYEFGLTWEAAHERDLLSRIVPNLVRPLEFFYPVFRKGRESRFAAVGLTIYDALSALRGVPRHRRARSGLRDYAPAIDESRVVAAWTYWDASTDDARLVFELIRAAHGQGASCANYCRVDGFDTPASNGVRAAAVTDVASGRTFEVRSRCFVNATGVWAGDVGALGGADLGIRPAKGVHLTFARDKLPVRAGCIVPSGMRDRRSIFAIPWAGRVIVGTTDTDYDGPLDAPSVSADDMDYCLAGVNKWLNAGLGRTDVVAAWAGLRPLRAGARTERTADLSRTHAVTVAPSGLVSITGGKLTTYRRMASDAVDAACEQIGVRARSVTARLRFGLSMPPQAVAADVADLLAESGASPEIAMRLVQTYGDLAPQVAASMAQDPALTRPVAHGLDVTGAEVRWAVEREMAVALDDVLARRTRLALTDRTGGLGGDAPELVAGALAWDAATLARESSAYAAALSAERGPAAPPVLTTARG